MLAEKKTVTNVSFCVGGADRLDNKMSGKSKRVSTEFITQHIIFESGFFVRLFLFVDAPD